MPPLRSRMPRREFLKIDHSRKRSDVRIRSRRTRCVKNLADWGNGIILARTASEFQLFEALALGFYPPVVLLVSNMARLLGMRLCRMTTQPFSQHQTLWKAGVAHWENASLLLFECKGRARPGLCTWSRHRCATVHFKFPGPGQTIFGQALAGSANSVRAQWSISSIN
jgi:hypothetical protein